MGYILILGTVTFTVYGQLILKWRIVKYGLMPELFTGKILFFIKLLYDPFIISSLFSAFIASLCWMAAMTKLELSHAYPFMGSTFIIILFFSVFLFNEHLTLNKIVGVTCITLGIIISSW